MSFLGAVLIGIYIGGVVGLWRGRVSTPLVALAWPAVICWAMFRQWTRI